MLSDQDKALQRAFDRKIRELEELIDDMGSTRPGAQDKGSPELKHALNKLIESTHWMRQHYYKRVIQPTRSANPSPGGGGGSKPERRPYNGEQRSEAIVTRVRARTP